MKLNDEYNAHAKLQSNVSADVSRGHGRKKIIELMRFFLLLGEKSA